MSSTGSSDPRFPVQNKKISLEIKSATNAFIPEETRKKRTGKTWRSYDLRFLQRSLNSNFCSPFSTIGRGNKTDIVICSYDDHFLVIATQIGTMGTILQARKEEGMAIHPTFAVSVIFGKRDEPMLVACARQLIELISISGSSKHLVLSLGLKDHSTETLKGIVSAVAENGLWF